MVSSGFFFVVFFGSGETQYFFILFFISLFCMRQAYVVSFKLETDLTLVIPKARLALTTYGHQLVVANLLQTRATTVTLVDPQVGD